MVWQAYPVVPTQEFTIGQALPNGVVLLDLSIAGDPDVEVTAFWLAHEYGHQVLGHPSLLVTPMGQYVAAVAGTYHEDAADEWAAEFLDAAGYSVEPVLSFLCAMPGGGYGDSHSDGPTRASNVAAAYGVDVPGEVCDEMGIDQVVTHEPSLRIWSRSQGDAATLDVFIDEAYGGSLSNLDEAETLELGALEEGAHAFSLQDITIYHPMYGVVASGMGCSGTLYVESSRTLRLSVRMLPNGTIVCSLD